MVVFNAISIYFILGCTPSAPEPSFEPQPEPQPAPVDNPSFSRDEVRAYVWLRLPNDLPGGYAKTQFSPDTRLATYQGNKKWKFEVLGSGEIIVPLPTQIYKETNSFSWVEQTEEEITTYEMRLTVVFYEKMKVVEILDIEKFNIKTENKVSKISIYPELLVHWVIATYSGSSYHFEGSVTNVGKMPLQNAEVEITDYDSEDNLILTQRTPLYPDTIGVGEMAHFNLRYRERIDLRYYDYRFILSSGEEIFYRVEPED